MFVLFTLLETVKSFKSVYQDSLYISANSVKKNTLRDHERIFASARKDSTILWWRVCSSEVVAMGWWKVRWNWKGLTAFHSTSIASNILRIIADERKLVSRKIPFTVVLRRQTVKTQFLRTFEVALVNTFLHAGGRRRSARSRWSFARQECAAEFRDSNIPACTRISAFFR